MELQNVHINSIEIQFEANSKMPSDKEIFGFFRKRKWAPETLVAMFRAPRECSVYVKFQSEDILKSVLLQCPADDVFYYDNGGTAKITYATARGDFRYVRIFGLPIEVDDKHVVNVLGNFGKVHRTTRERYGPDTGFPILNGVRGVHIELAKTIPEVLHVQHFRVHVTYEGMPSKCFVCSSTAHVKANCPKRSAGKTSASGTESYAEAVKQKTTLGKPNKRNEIQSEDQANASKTSKNTENTIAFQEMAFGITVEEEGGELSGQRDEDQDNIEDSTLTAAKERDRAIRQSHPLASANGSDSSESDERPGVRRIPRPPFRISELQSIAKRTRMQNNLKKAKNDAS